MASEGDVLEAAVDELDAGDGGSPFSAVPVDVADEPVPDALITDGVAVKFGVAAETEEGVDGERLGSGVAVVSGAVTALVDASGCEDPLDPEPVFEAADGPTPGVPVVAAVVVGVVAPGETEEGVGVVFDGDGGVTVGSRVETALVAALEEAD